MEGSVIKEIQKESQMEEFLVKESQDVSKSQRSHVITTSTLWLNIIKMIKGPTHL